MGHFTRLIPLDTRTVLAWRGVIGAMGIAVVIGHAANPMI